MGGGGQKKRKRMCSLLVHMAIRREAKLRGLILQQQPACLLTALWAFAAAQMPRGRFAWLWLHPSVSLSVFVSSTAATLRGRASPISCSNFSSDKEFLPRSTCRLLKITGCLLNWNIRFISYNISMRPPSRAQIARMKTGCLCRSFEMGLHQKCSTAATG